VLHRLPGEADLTGNASSHGAGGKKALRKSTGVRISLSARIFLFFKEEKEAGDHGKPPARLTAGLQSRRTYYN
jgi:hypothetical protein